MKTHILKGSKQEIAKSLVQLSGEIREAIVFEEEPTPAASEAAPHGVDDVFSEMGPLMVDVRDGDDSREVIYTPMEGE